uniref:Telomeric repeat-binding factor 2-interacting protein 1 n=1 Tax=Cacopsylla melanoneura TaxID=428564 RepID=A0A8D9A970_9HEMI
MHTRSRIPQKALSNSEPTVLLENVIPTRSSSLPPESSEPLTDSQFEQTVLTKANENQTENTNVSNTRITRQTNFKCLSKIIQEESSEQSSQKKRICPKTNRYQSSLRNFRKSNSESNMTSSVAKSPDLNLSGKSTTIEHDGCGETQVETTENTVNTIVNNGWGETQTLEKFPDDTLTVEDNRPVEQDSNQLNSLHGSDNNIQPCSSTDIENNTSKDNEDESNQTCKENTHNSSRNSSCSSILEGIPQIENYLRRTSGELLNTQNSSPEKNTQMVWEDVLSNYPGEGKNNTNGKKENENVQGNGNVHHSNKNTEAIELVNLLEGNSEECVVSSLTSTDGKNMNTEEHSVECIENSDPRSKTSKNTLKDQNCGSSSKKVEESDSQSSDDEDAKSTDDNETLTNKENEKLLTFLCYHSVELLDLHNDVIWKRIGARQEFKQLSWQVYKENFFNNLVERTENYNVPIYFSKHVRQKYVTNSNQGNPVLKIRGDLFPTQNGPNFNNTLNETSKDNVRTPTKNKVRTPTKNRNDGKPNTVTRNSGEKIRTPSKKRPESNSVERNSSHSGGSQGKHNQTPRKGPKIKYTTGKHSATKERTPLKKSRVVNRIRSDSSSSNEEMAMERFPNKNQAEKVSTRKSQSDFDSSDSSDFDSVNRSRIVTRTKTGKSTNPSPNKSKKDQTGEASELSGDNSECSEYNPFKTLTSKYFNKEPTDSPNSDKHKRRQSSSPNLDRQSRKRSSRNSGGNNQSPTPSGSVQRGTKRARMTPPEYVNKSSTSETEMSDSDGDRLVIQEPQGSSRSKENQPQSNSSKTKENPRESNRSQNQSQSRSSPRGDRSSIGSILTPAPSKPQSNIRSIRMPYLSYEKVNMIKYLIDNTTRLDSIKGNVFWKEMEGAGAVPGRTWQSLKNHFFRSLVFELDTYSLDSKFRKRLEMYSAR